MNEYNASEIKKIEKFVKVDVKRRRRTRIMYNIALSISIPFTLFILFIFLFVGRGGFVPTDSMNSAVPAGSFILTEFWSVKHEGKDGFERGNVVLFMHDDDDDLEKAKEIRFLKRIVGMPGETIEIKDGLVYINGSKEPLEEKYVNLEKPTGDFGPYVIPKTDFFVMGDNRNDSYDSRYFGSIPIDIVKQKAVWKVFPEFEKIE